MLVKVKENARFSVYTACGGMTFTKKVAVDVPDEKKAEVAACDFLEVVDESKPAEMTLNKEVEAVEMTEERLEAVVPEEEKTEEEKKPKSRSKKEA